MYGPRGYSSEGIAMARGNYRKLHCERYPWHFCTNCQHWPTSGYESSTTVKYPLCNVCEAMEKANNCKWSRRGLLVGSCADSVANVKHACVPTRNAFVIA